MGAPVTPNAFVAIAAVGGMPRRMSMGNVSKLWPPTRTPKEPAMIPMPKTIMMSTKSIHGFL